MFRRGLLRSMIEDALLSKNSEIAANFRERTLIATSEETHTSAIAGSPCTSGLLLPEPMKKKMLLTN